MAGSPFRKQCPPFHPPGPSPQIEARQGSEPLQRRGQCRRSLPAQIVVTAESKGRAGRGVAGCAGAPRCTRSGGGLRGSAGSCPAPSPTRTPTHVRGPGSKQAECSCCRQPARRLIIPRLHNRSFPPAPPGNRNQHPSSRDISPPPRRPASPPPPVPRDGEGSVRACSLSQEITVWSTVSLERLAAAHCEHSDGRLHAQPEGSILVR